nr:LOW QUALITY PROTEIN: kinesin-like protein KIF26A [Dasypus novemcinctus]
MGGRGAPSCAAPTAVAEGGPGREPLPPLEVTPRERLPVAPEQDPCGNRPAPEGAGASAEQSHWVGGGWCRHCHTKLAELKQQAWRLVSGPGTPLRDPRLPALLLDQLPVPAALPECHPEAVRRCDVCAARLSRLAREALQLRQAPASREEPDVPHAAPGAMAGPRDAAARQPAPDRRRGPAWPPGPSVQVSVAPAGLGGALSTVTIQAQQCLEGVWSVSRVDRLLPPACLAEAAVAAVAVADTVRDAPAVGGPRGAPRTWGHGGACVGPALGSPGPSAAAAFFMRAAQKLSLAAKRKRGPPPPAPARTASTYPTDFSGALRLWPPPAPPCLLRAAPKAKDSTCGVGKVRVVLRIWPAQGPQRAAGAASCLKVDPRKKQVTLHDPAAGLPGGAGPRRATSAAVPRTFAFDAVFPQDAEQAEVCSATVTDVLQAVVGGADGCIFSFGHTSLGKSHTMIGEDGSARGLGVVPCAIAWLFKLLGEQRQRAGTRFSVRVSAVEVCGREPGVRDLLAEVASGSPQDPRSPGACLREDPACGAQLQSQSELRAPTAEKAAFYLDAALAARGSSRPGCGEDARRSSHLLFTLHVYQYRMERGGQGGMSGGRSRLHLIDLGSCGASGGAGEAPGGPPCLSPSALGSVLLALLNGAKHVPYRDHRLTVLLREALASSSCRATMIAHVSDAPARHAETLSTVQVAARLHRLRRRKAKDASSSSGGESSCEEGCARRPPLLRPFHPRTVALDPERLAPGPRADPDYSSSSEQSCDTVVYVGPGGAVLSDRELTDNEGPPDFVPIVPALSGRRPPQTPRDADSDHLRCSTFAELQERLEWIDGREGPPAGPACDSRGPSPPEQAGARGELREASGPGPDLAAAGGDVRPLPGPAPPPPRQPEEPGGGDPDGGARGSSAGTYGQEGRTPRPLDAGSPRLPARGRCLERGLLTATVTLQQPVELNGEDELVFMVVEELPLGGQGSRGRPASLASFGSDCSLQALASGSRPVSIISSLNDEMDACTGPGGAPGLEDGGHGSPVSTWRGELGLCAVDGHGPVPQPPLPGSPETHGPSSPAGPEPLGAPGLEGGSSGSSAPRRAGGPRPVDAAPVTPAHAGREPKPGSPRGPRPGQTIHSSLPRKPRAASTTGRAGCPPRGPEGPLEDPWTRRMDDGAAPRATSPGCPWPPEARLELACTQRVVDGCEVVARVARPPEAVARIPPLRRGATTLGVSTPTAACAEVPAPSGSLKPPPSPGSRRGPAARGGLLPRPSGTAAPAPPVRKSSLEHRGGPGPAAAPRGEEEARPGVRADQAAPRAAPGWRGRPGKAEGAQRPAGHCLLERSEGPVPGGRAREAAGRPGRAVPRLGVPSASPTPGPAPACRGSPAKAAGAAKPPAGGGSKGRSLAAVGTRAPHAAGRPPGGPVATPRAAPRVAPGVGAKAGRGTVMGAKQALRAAHSRVHELAAGGAPGAGPSWGSADSDSGNDSGVNVAEERPALPSPYSTVTAPRRPQRYSSGHGSDNSSVLSGELPPAMGRTALFYHGGGSGGSSGYESVVRDSEATGSASSAPDSTSESGAASPGARARSLKSPKKRATGLQRRRLIPAPLPDAAALGRKAGLPGQWVDLPPPLASARKEPFEIKVYEIDDVQRLQRHRPPPPDAPTEPYRDVEEGLRPAARREQRLRELRAEHESLRRELAATQGRLMVEPGRWRGQFEVDPALEPESAEYLAALERVTASLAHCVDLCKAHVMMVTCFDIGVAAAAPGPREVDV